jgi:hypothetical protein
MRERHNVDEVHLMKISLVAMAVMLPAGLALAQAGNQSGASAQSQSQKTANQESTTSKSGGDKAANPAELKTQTYKGTLVDASCAAGGSPSTSTSKSTSQSAADRSASSTKSASESKTGEANRGGGQSCEATSSTSEFALRMKDGTTTRFDAVGNDRAKQAIAAKKKWSDALAAGKPVQATVSGTESGDRLTVVSIH